MSPTIGALAEALAAAQAEFPRIPKGKKATIQSQKGASFSYAYADLADVLAAALPIAAKHGLAVTQPTDDDKLITLLIHTSGEWIAGSWPLGDYNDPRTAGSALTYYRRYCVCSILGIAADEDDDAETAPKQKARKQEARKQEEKPEERKADPEWERRYRQTWAEIRRVMGPEADQFLREVCRDKHVESSKQLTLKDLNDVIATLADLHDFQEPLPRPDTPARGEPSPEEVSR